MEIVSRFLKKFRIKKLPINQRGCWEGFEEIDSYAPFDRSLADFLVSFFKEEGETSVVDFGCGTGDYVKTLLQHQIPCEGYDGNPYTPQLTKGLGKIADLSQPLDLNKKFDWVLSLEVGEHIPKEYEKTFIDNLHRHNTKGIILSWAIIGQRGHGHCNEQNNAYIKNLMAEYGYENDLTKENAMRSHSTLEWFKNTIMVFRKNMRPSHYLDTFICDSYS